jgi:hypothetical protein
MLRIEQKNKILHIDRINPSKVVSADGSPLDNGINLYKVTILNSMDRTATCGYYIDSSRDTFYRSPKYNRKWKKYERAIRHRLPQPIAAAVIKHHYYIDPDDTAKDLISAFGTVEGIAEWGILYVNMERRGKMLHILA